MGEVENSFSLSFFNSETEDLLNYILMITDTYGYYNNFYDGKM